jgi:hypothetical protein
MVTETIIAAAKTKKVARQATFSKAIFAVKSSHELRAESRLPELKQHTVDFPNVVLFVRDKIGNNQVALIGWRKRKFSTRKQILCFVQI